MSAFIPQLLGVFFLLFLKIVDEQEYQLIILPESSILLKGNSNVNKFTFTYEKALKLGSNSVKASSAKNMLQLKNAKLDAAVTAFSSGNNLMDRDYRNMMNYRVYPNISIALNKINFVKNYNNDNGTALATVDITIAGEKRTDTLQFNYNKLKGIYRCSSSHPISLRDYKIKPLKKMMGLISLKDQLMVDMILYLKVD
ncbi:YceI family protein [Pedobacter sp. UBA4863]|uniref:YceI family protein n=1 Tax=Pedobacter sp. UBA4863 TaxID=1947060 RepID=UPI0025FD1D86|nr:YceI family protein [Pedobacter sp. UBA4863]